MLCGGCCGLRQCLQIDVSVGGSAGQKIDDLTKAELILT